MIWLGVGCVNSDRHPQNRRREPRRSRFSAFIGTFCLHSPVGLVLIVRRRRVFKGRATLFPRESCMPIATGATRDENLRLVIETHRRSIFEGVVAGWT